MNEYKVSQRMVKRALNAHRLHTVMRRVLPGEQLRFSHYYQNAAGVVTHKTCPCCSQLQRKPVWYPIGVFSTRTLASGKVVLQSWCADCR